jgi:galactonate dehydratase
MSSTKKMASKIKSIEYFRVKPRWLFVKICDDQGEYG